MTIINPELTRKDFVLPCPFCGSNHAELRNTHTASYWMECACGAEMHGEPSRGKSMAAHRRAANSALSKWNDRAVEE